MPITTQDFPGLTDDLQEVYNEAAKSELATMVGFKVFKVLETNRRTYDWLAIHGLNVIKSVAQGADLDVAASDQGNSATYTQARYGGIVAITKDMRMFDLYDEIQSLVRDATQDAFEKIDQSLADVLLYGWASSYSDVYDDTVTNTTPDSQNLFYTAHTFGVSTASGTYRNQIRLLSSGSENPLISRDAIVDMQVDAAVYKDPEGMVRPYRIDKLLVAPAKYDIAQRIVYSAGVQGTPNVDSNPLKGVLEVIQWERLQTRTGGTDTSAYWFGYDSKKVGDALKCIFAERPSLDAPEQVYKNKNWEYSIDFYYTIGRGHPAAIRGSNATQA